MGNNHCCGLCPEQSDSNAGARGSGASAGQDYYGTNEATPLLRDGSVAGSLEDPTGGVAAHASDLLDVSGQIMTPPPSHVNAPFLASSIARQSLPAAGGALTGDQAVLSDILQATANQIIDCTAAAATAAPPGHAHAHGYVHGHAHGRHGALEESELAERAVEYGQRLSSQSAVLAAKHFPPPLLRESAGADAEEQSTKEQYGPSDLVLADVGHQADALLVQQPSEELLTDTDQVLVSEVVSRARETVESDMADLEEQRDNLMVSFTVQDILQSAGDTNDASAALEPHPSLEMA